MRKLKMKINVDYIECFEEKERVKKVLTLVFGVFLRLPQFSFFFRRFFVCVFASKPTLQVEV